jgi:DNA modification methylase
MNDINTYLNQIICGDNVSILRQFPDESIDLTVTSPPYDKLRLYKGYSFDFETIANELYRVTKRGGVVAWIVGDGHDKNGSETLTSFRQALYFKEIGFNVHDTMIYQKNSYPFPPSNRYYQQFEYMFVLSKAKPKTTNIQRQETVWKKDTSQVSTTRKPNGNTVEMKYQKGLDTRKMDNVWVINTGYMRSTKDKIAYQHPAMFPEILVERHIISWSNENDIILDPFVGSGTTCKMAKLLNRNYIGIDISDEYCEIARQRIASI